MNHALEISVGPHSIPMIQYAIPLATYDTLS